MDSLTVRFIAGALAGLFAWMILEPSRPPMFSPEWLNWEMRLTLLLGAFVGAAVGALNGLNQGSRAHLIRGAALGAFLGAIGCALGHSVGSGLARGLFGGVSSGVLPNEVLSRMAALTPIGAGLGGAIGAAGMNAKRLVSGLIGGSIGGAIGGLAFNFIGAAIGPAQLAVAGASPGSSNEVGAVSRALYASLVGGCVALFVGLVDRLMRSAWLRLRLGRNEGKEWPLDWAETYIGRNETAQVPLLGDPNVAPVHAVIRRHGGQYTVFDAGSPIGIAVNGQRVAQAVLLPGSVLQIGSFALEFLTKNAPHPARGPEAYPGQAYPMGASPVPVGVPASLPSANPPTIMSGAAHPAAATATLTALDGPLAGQRFPLSAQVEVGRDSPIIPLAHDSQVSRRHAALSPAVGSVELRDLGSTNGTFVNGARATTATLRPGDTVRFGGSSFRVDIS